MTSEETRAAVLTIAALNLGVDDPSEFWLDAYGSVPPKHLAWCGVFALYCLRKGAGVDWLWSVASIKSGFLFRLERTTDPQPGDVAYFDQPYQHHALVQKIEGDRLYLIQGNYGTPGHVAESQCGIATKKPAFFSIGRVLDLAEHD